MCNVSTFRQNVNLTEKTKARGKILHNVLKRIKAISSVLSQNEREREEVGESANTRGPQGKREGSIQTG